MAVMKAPMSKRARRLLSDPETARKVMNAARKEDSSPVKVNGKTYVVRNAPEYNPDDSPKNGGLSNPVDCQACSEAE